MNSLGTAPGLLRRRLQRDRGAVAVIMSILMVLLIGMAAFTIDYGYAYAQRRALSTTADGAALAAAREFQLRRTNTDTCSTLITLHSTAATDAANEILTANGQGGAGVAMNYDCSAGYLGISAHTTKESPSFFGGIYGQDGYAIQRVSKATVAPAGSTMSGGFRPFGLCETDAQRVLNGLQGVIDPITGEVDVSTPVKIHLAKTVGTLCGLDVGETISGSGNESRIQLDPSLDDYLEAMTSTAPMNLSVSNGQVTCPFQTAPSGWCAAFPGVGGTNSQVTTAINALLDTSFMFPVYDKTSGEGSNTRYRISGFISATLCGWQLKNIEESQGKPKVNAGLCYDSSVANRFVKADGDALQLRAARYVPPSQLATCGPDGLPATSGSPCPITTNTFVPIISKLIG